MFDLQIDKVILGDCRENLKKIPDCSADLVLTSPPYYHQRDYGATEGTIGQEKNVDEYIENLEEVFCECLRIIKASGSIVFNIGDKYENGSLLLVPYLFAHRMLTCTNAKLLNVVTWVKPNPQPRQFQRRLVSSTEPFFHFVKSPSYKYFRDKFNNENGTRTLIANGQSKVGKGYIELIKASDLSEEQKKLAFKELEEVMSEVRQGKIFSFRMKIRGIHSAAYGGYEGGRKNHIKTKGFTIIRMFGKPMKRDVIESPILNLRYVHHPAIYPERVVKEIINLTTEVNDLVVDPFLGSGTTAVVAKQMGRHFTGYEINPEYCEIAENRIKSTATESIDMWLREEQNERR